MRSNVHFWYLSLSDFRGRAAGEKLLKEEKAEEIGKARKIWVNEG